MTHSELYKLGINKTKVIKNSRELKQTLQNLERAIMKGSLDNDFSIDFTQVNFDENLKETIQNHRVQMLRDLYAIQNHLDQFNSVMKIKDKEGDLETDSPLQTIMELGTIRFADIMKKIVFHDARKIDFCHTENYDKKVSVSLNDLLRLFGDIMQKEEDRIYAEKEMDKAFGVKKKKNYEHLEGMIGRDVGTELYTMPDWEKDAKEKKKEELARIKRKKMLVNKAVKIGITYEQLTKEINRDLRTKTGQAKQGITDSEIAEMRVI